MICMFLSSPISVVLTNSFGTTKLALMLSPCFIFCKHITATRVHFSSDHNHKWGTYFGKWR